MAVRLLHKFPKFREQEEFIDVRLKVGEDVFPAHRNVLAANSDYFYAMFTGGMRESNQEVIELKDENISGDALKIILDSIYSGELTEKKKVFEILAVANQLQVTSIVQQCYDLLDREFLQRELDVQTYVRLSTFANTHDLKNLQEATQRKMASIYWEICDSADFLSYVDADQLSSLLSRDDLSAPSETFVFKSVLQWIRYKKEERMAVAAKLIGAVRLGLVDIKDVIEELNTEEMQGVPEIQAIFSQALLHNHMPSQTSKFGVENAKPRSMSTVLVAVCPRSKEHKTHKQELTFPFSCYLDPVMNYFDFETKTWKLLLSMASLKLHHKVTFLCAEYVGSHLYVATTSGDIYRYHVVNNVWETLPRFQSAAYRNHPINCLCSINDYIYAISNTDLIQRYSLAKKNWQSGSQLPFLKSCDTEDKLTHVSAVVMKSKIYVLHGYHCVENLNLFEVRAAVVHCFDPQTNEWEQKASTRHPHFGSTLFVNENKLYVIGGNCSVSRDNYDVTPNGDPAPVEVYDEVRNRWSIVKQTHIPPNRVGAVEINGKVFFVINKFPVDSGIKIPPGEVYHISLQEWTGIGSIGNDAIMCYLPVKVDSLKTEPPCSKRSPVRKNIKGK